MNLSSIISTALRVAPVFLGPMAPLAIAQQFAVRAVASELVGFAARELGVPNMLASALQSSGLPGLGGGIAGALIGQGMSPRAAAGIERSVRSAVRDSQQEVRDFLKDQLAELNRNNEKRRAKGEIDRIANGKGSILMKLAMIMGMVADQKLEGMMSKARDIGAMGEIDGKNQAKFTQANAELQALSQEFGIVSQAMTNVIKTTGEAQATIARKG